MKSTCKPLYERSKLLGFKVAGMMRHCLWAGWCLAGSKAYSFELYFVAKLYLPFLFNDYHDSLSAGYTKFQKEHLIKHNPWRHIKYLSSRTTYSEPEEDQ